MAVKKSKVGVAKDVKTKTAAATKPAATKTPKAKKPAPAVVAAVPAKVTPKAKKTEPAPIPAPEPAPVAAKPKAKAKTSAVAVGTASKAETPKPSASPQKASPVPAVKKAETTPAKKAPAAVKLTGRQVEFLKQIQDAKELGYLLGKKAEQKTIDALLDRKLIKKGAKDKTSGHYRYMVSKAGEKHLSTLPANP